MFPKVTDDFEYLCLQLDTLGCFKGPPVLEIRSPVKGQTFALAPAPNCALLSAKKGNQNQQPLEKSKTLILR